MEVDPLTTGLTVAYVSKKLLDDNVLLVKMYEDILHLPATRVGQILENLVKIVSVPPQLAADLALAAQVRAQRYIERIRDKVPEEQRIPAPLKIACESFQGMDNIENEKILIEMFLNLIASSIDKERVHLAHPSFPALIKQLSRDEAIILCCTKSNIWPTISERTETIWSDPEDAGEGKIRKPKQQTNRIKTNIPLEKLVFPQNLKAYLSHLHSLNLLTVIKDDIAIVSKLTELVKVPNDIVDFSGSIMMSDDLSVFHTFKQSSFGALFANACIPDNIDEFL